MQRFRPPDTPGPHPGVTVAILVGAFLADAVLALVLVAIVPLYERSFNDFRIHVPWHTELVLLASRAVRGSWQCVVPAVVLFGLPGVALLTWLLRHRVRRVWLDVLWILLLIGLPLLAALLLLVSCQLVMYDLAVGLGR